MNLLNKATLIKIAFALAVISLYTYIFGIMDIVGNEQLAVDNEQLTVTESATQSTNQQPPEFDSATRPLPGFADYDAPVIERTTAATPASEQTEAATSSVASVITEPIITLPDFIPPASTPASATQNTNNNPPSNETLRVMSGGKLHEGNAFDIVCRVVQGEIGDKFHREAIKAQAVAAYTFIRNYNLAGKTPTLPMKDASQRVKDCVNEVWGQGLYFNGELIQAIFCASSAGWTSSAKNVWGEDIPYLRSKRTEFDEKYDPNRGITATFSSSEIKTNVQKQTGIMLAGDPENWLKIVGLVDNVYVGQMTIGGKTTYRKDGKDVTITGRNFREQIMNFSLRSASFSYKYDRIKDSFTFTMNGYGHGVGLSQNGANILATYHSHSYEDILRFYFPGTQLK